MHNLPQFWNAIESMATFTTVISVFGPLRLLVGDKSFWMDAVVRVKMVILSGLEAHQTKLYVSQCWTSGGDSSSRLVQGFPVTANIKDYVTTIQEITHTSIAKSVNCHQVIVMDKHHIAIRCFLRSSH